MYTGGRNYYERYTVPPPVNLGPLDAIATAEPTGRSEGAAAGLAPDSVVWPSHHSIAQDAYLQVEPPPFNTEDPLIPPAQPATPPAPTVGDETRGTVTNNVRDYGCQPRGGDSTYVLRIHEMLEDAEKEGQTHIVSWQPHGRAFRIHNEMLFVSQVMPRYFRAKIGSFRRWLRAWGFVRMTEGKDRGAWYHRYFVRGVTSLCKDMTRQEMQHAMVNWPPAGEVPDFYRASSGSTLSEQRLPAPMENSNPTQEGGKNPKRLRGTILEDIRQMLEDAEREGHTHIVGWMPHGRAFKVHNKAQFQGLMRRYFRTSKLTHLSDTLRIWGFHRLKKPGPDKGCYYHKLFVKGKPELSRHQTRIQMKDSMEGWPTVGGEPDLYRLPEAPAAVAPAVPRRDQTTLVSEQRAIHGVPLVEETQQPHPTVNHAPLAAQIPHHYGNHSIHFTHHTPPMATTGAGDMATYATGISNLVENPTPTEPEDLFHKGDSGGTYVLRIHEMLEDAEKEGNQAIVSWQSHGRAFRIHREEEFVEIILPRYFKAKLGSFLRWLRAWGFCRMTEGKDRGAWYHRYFVRGVTSLSKKLTRQQMFQAMQDWLPPGQVPNFYTPGMGGELSEAKPDEKGSTPKVTCSNPKRLRGTVPEDLRQMLEDSEVEGNTHVVAWLPHGRSFKVFDRRMFTEQILPRYFRAAKFTYFSDALRIWGFQRIKQGRDKGSYYHKLFAKGQPQLSRHMTRTQMKTSMTPWPPKEGEPDLYAPMKPAPPPNPPSPPPELVVLQQPVALEASQGDGRRWNT